MLRRFSGLFVLVVIVLGNLGVWWLMNRPATDVVWDGMISSISFSPFRKDDDPFQNKYPTLESIDSDLALVSKQVKAIRLYNSSEGDDQSIPAMAAKHGLTVTAGAWIRGALAEPALRLDKQPGQMNPDELKAYQLQMAALTANEQEIDGVIEMARANPNVTRVIIGTDPVQTISETENCTSTA